MVNSKFLSKNPSKRGISTIVGGLIFLVLLSAGFSTFFLALDIQQDTINTQRKISDSIMDKTREKFAIAVSTNQDDNNRLGIQVKNLGNNPVEVANIWIVNQSGNYEATKHEVDYSDAFIPIGYGANILDKTPLYMATDTYEIKVISTLGTIEKSELSVGGASNLRAELFAIPPDVKINKNVTLTLHVENVGNSKLYNVQPALGLPNISTPFNPPNPPIPAPVDLDPAESAFFTWKYIVKGAGLSAGSTVDFDVYANATEDETGFTINSNVAYEKIKLAQPDESELIVLTEDLVSRPEIFMVIPAPFGDGPEKAIWGTNIVNPTGQDMFVSKVVMTLLSPRANSLDRIWSASSGSQYCDPVAVPPTPDRWSCPENNELVWENIASPQRIPPYSVFPFLAQVHADRLSGSTDTLEAIIVTGNVFTTVGEFSKAGYSSSMDNGGNSYVNVYLSDVVDSINPANIRTNQTVGSGLSHQFNVILADFQAGAPSIDDGSRLIINMPKGWTVDEGSINGFGDFTWNYLNFTDTSSQIVADLSADLTYGGKTIQFDATAPVVNNEQMYVMYVLADGKTTSQDFSLGPLSEVVLKVTP